MGHRFKCIHFSSRTKVPWGPTPPDNAGYAILTTTSNGEWMFSERIAETVYRRFTRAKRISYGFLVFDDTGSEWTRAGQSFALRLFPNRFVYSREQNRSSAPYLTIEMGPEDRQPPAAPSDLLLDPATATLPAG
jgi:hypothetical protein